MKIVVSGSIAYDFVMKFDGAFSEQILPENLDHLSVSFVVSSMEKHPGGTAQNIAYNLGVLGYRDSTLMLGAVGKDFLAEKELETFIDYTNILVDHDLYTASAFMISDDKNNQIIPFHPGALNSAYKQPLDETMAIDYVIVAPNNREAMLLHLSQGKAMGAKVFFCPGQMTSFRAGEDLLKGIERCDYLVCNEYEFDLIKQKTGLTKDDIISKVGNIIITLGESGSMIYTQGGEIKAKGYYVQNPKDPTGAGDSFVASFVTGLAEGKSQEESLKFANIVASFVVEESGTMNHKPTRQDILQRFNTTFVI